MGEVIGGALDGMPVFTDQDILDALDEFQAAARDVADANGRYMVAQTKWEAVTEFRRKLNS